MSKFEIRDSRYETGTGNANEIGESRGTRIRCELSVCMRYTQDSNFEFRTTNLDKGGSV